METLKKPLFLWCSLLFVLHQVFQKLLFVSLPLVDAYLDNLLAMPILLSLLQWERNFFYGKEHARVLSRVEVALATVYTSILSEAVFPRLSSRFTADGLDFLFFFAGAVLYLQGMRHKEKQTAGVPSS